MTSGWYFSYSLASLPCERRMCGDFPVDDRRGNGSNNKKALGWCYYYP